jgi:hypothetical protein
MMMRALLLLLFCMVCGSLWAQQPSASERLKEDFLAILRKQTTEFMAQSASGGSQVTREQKESQIESLVEQASAAYASIIILPEAEADQLLTTGPDDKANMTAMLRDIDLWKKVQRPMPALYKRMQDEVAEGKINGGLELELTRRISEFHLKQLGLLSP